MIHPTAIIDSKAELGADVSVGPYAIIGPDVKIGDGTTIGPHALIEPGARIGKNCRIFHGASIGGVPQDLKFGGEKTIITIGDGTTVREFCTLNRGTKAHGETRIGENCFIMAYCHAAHDCQIGNSTVIANSLAMAGHVEVGNNVNIGGDVAIHQFVKIGDHAFIGAKSWLTMDVVPFAICGSEPLRIEGINRIGLERRGFSVERRERIKAAYHILFRDVLLLKEAMAELERQFAGDPDVGQILSFIRRSERGLLRMRV